ncbi:MAG: ATP-grasp domain-containing protein [Thermoleophilia bacterium]
MSSSEDTSPRRILIHEYVTGGGWEGTAIPPSLVREGALMLRALLRDFGSWPKCRTVTTLDSRCREHDLPADLVVPTDPGALEGTLERLLACCDAALVVAPETGGALARLTKLVERSGRLLLGSRSSAVLVAGDKWECHVRFQTAGLPTPRTVLFGPQGWEGDAGELGLPVVVKPADGAGCEGLELLRTWAEFEAFTADLAADLTSSSAVHRPFLAQQYIPGVHASVSLLVGADDSCCLSLNRQELDLGRTFVLEGIEAGWKHPLGERACALAREAVRLVPGLRGYVGVDVVLAERECFLIEINPRLTTSYAYLAEVGDAGGRLEVESDQGLFGPEKDPARGWARGAPRGASRGPFRGSATRNPGLAALIWQVCAEGRLPDEDAEVLL